MREQHKLRLFGPDGVLVGYEAVIDGWWHFKTPNGEWRRSTWLIPELTRCRFTGLKDKNGREIYEGDVVKMYSLWTKGLEVCFHEGTFATFNPNVYEVWTLKQWSECEVIGNRYQNPELLKSAA